MKCNVIINPLSGKRNAAQVWQEVAPIFKDARWDTTVCVAKSNDITGYLDNCEGIIAVGGDGTFHNVVNQLMGSGRQIPLGLIPAGTGNALMTDLGCSNHRDAACQIVKGRRRWIDVLEITTAEETFYSLSVVGWGMFSAANQTAEKLRWLKGMRYNMAALWHILKKKTYPATIQFGNESEEGNFITVFASNTLHTGKGMKAAPKAQIDDGLMDLVMIKNEKRLTLLKLFKNFLNGRYIDHEQVTYRQVGGFQLQTTIRQQLDIDGEMTGYSPFSAQVLPKALELLL